MAGSLGLVVTAGSILGRAHARAHRNNQDGVALHAADDLIVAAVTDGCSSGRSSEVGARLAARWLAANVPRLASREPPGDLPSAVCAELTRTLQSLAADLSAGSGIDPAVVADYFLFTLLVAVVTPLRTLVFGIGDGVVSIDGETRILDPGPDNAPAYLAYRLLGPLRPDISGGRPGAVGAGPEATSGVGDGWPEVLVDRPTGTVRSLVIATDGVTDLVTRSQECLADGRPQGGLEQFEQDPRYLSNPTLLHKRLNVIGAVNGRLHDDATLVLIRRRR